MFVNKKHFRNCELKFFNHSYLNFSGQILKKVNTVDLGKKKDFYQFLFADSNSSIALNDKMNFCEILWNKKYINFFWF